MTLFRHEVRQGRKQLLGWSIVLVVLLSLCVVIYPEFQKQAHLASEMFSKLGAFASAFGLDRLNLGDFVHFYALECGNILGIGGTMFAALLGIMALAKEEKDHTSEFLLTHPVTRVRVLTEKLLAVWYQVTVLNLLTSFAVIATATGMGIAFDFKILSLIFLAYYLMQLQIAAMCFGISAFIRRSGFGIGLGMALLLYFFKIMSNISDKFEILKWFTPHSYAEATTLVGEKAIPLDYLVVGLVLGLTGIALAYWKYVRKDLQS